MEKSEPYSIEAEESVLGGMILDRDVIGGVIEILVDESVFYLDAHKRIYRAIIELYDNNVPIDLISLTNHLKKKGELELVGGGAYIAEIIDNVISTANVVEHAKIVRDKAALRHTIKVCNKIIESAYDESIEVDELIDKAEQLIFSIKEKRVEKGFVSLGKLIKPSITAIEELRKRKTFITGLPTGFDKLDELTAGFHPNELIIIAGRPTVGKTSFALNIAQNLAIRSGYRVGIFSLEMSKEQVAQRILCSEAKISLHKVRRGELEKWVPAKLASISGILYEAPIFIDDTPRIPLLELKAKSRRLRARENISTIIIDYLQLITGPKSETRQLEIARITAELKAMAKELSIPVIAVSQLSREPEKRRAEESEPRLSDLRESGAIEQDADTVLFLYPSKEEKITILKIAKQRNGPTGKIKLVFKKEYTTFFTPTAEHAVVEESLEE